jgi:peptidase E
MVNSVTLVAGGCRTTNFTKSKEYIQKIKEWFLQQDGIKTVNIRFREHPDDDFVYMVRSNHFIQSGGGFSALIGKLRDMR